MNVQQTIKTLTKIPNNISVMLKGNHGIGKSQVVAEAANILGIPCIDFRLSQNDVGDIKGIPFQRNGRTVFAPPEFFPLKEEDAQELKELLGLSEDISLGRFGDKGILFLDEINRASKEVQQAAFELVLDRRLNLRSLPDGWRVVTAVNDNDDIYNVGALDPAFISRFMLIDFNPTIEEWFTWARDKGVHDAVMTFLTKYPELLDPNTDTIEENNAAGVKKLFDRRSWHRFSETIQNFEAEGEKLLAKNSESLDYLTMLASGFVGNVAATKFRSYIENDYDALSADIILNKFNKSVKAKLTKIVKAGRIPELASYNDLLIAYAIKEGKLSNANHKNLTKYLALMPKEIVAGFWQSFNQDAQELSEAWYASDSANAQLILDALVNPESM